MHYGLAAAKAAERAAVLEAAYLAHPERFPHGPPAPPRSPSAVWINKPTSQPEPESSTTPRAPAVVTGDEASALGGAAPARGGGEPRGPGGAAPGEAPVLTSAAALGATPQDAAALLGAAALLDATAKTTRAATKTHNAALLGAAALLDATAARGATATGASTATTLQ